MTTRRELLAATSLMMSASSPMATPRADQVYVHLFVFRLKASVTEEQKNRIVSHIQALQGQIPGLSETWVGKNISPRGNGYEIGGAMKFADFDAYSKYSTHPAHQALLSWLVPLIDAVEVDFPVGQ